MLRIRVRAAKHVEKIDVPADALYINLNNIACDIVIKMSAVSKTQTAHHG